MKKKGLFLMSLVLILAFVFVLTGCGDPEEVDPDEPVEERIDIATATTGGTFYPLGIALSHLLEQQIDGLRASASSSAGSVENIALLRGGETTMAIIQNNIGQWAYEGIEAFEGEPLEDLRMVMPIVVSGYHLLVDEASDIDSWQDVEGTRFVIGRAGSGNESSCAAIFDALGYSFDDINPERIGHSEGFDAVQDGRVDGMLALGGIPMGGISDALMTPGSRAKLVDIPLEEAETINEQYPWIFPFTIPAGTYPDQDEDVQALGHNAYILTTEGMLSEELVYEIVMTTFDEDNIQVLLDSHDAFNNHAFMSPEEYLDFPIPLHPGAERAYEELGLL